MSAVACRSKGFPNFRQSITWGREPLGIYGEITITEKKKASLTGCKRFHSGYSGFQCERKRYRLEESYAEQVVTRRI